MPSATAVFILGPTATGKTKLSLSLAKKINGEIISCDSRQFYRELNIGTAKPALSDLADVKHHFINSLSILQPFTVADYETRALKVIEHIFRENKVPIVTGGSGLFARALIGGLNEIPPADPAIRKGLIKIFDSEGLSPLLEKLKELDYPYYQEVDKFNHRRIIRALEVCISTGISFSAFRSKPCKSRNFKQLLIGLFLPLEILYERINIRCEEMLKNGLLDEVKQLLPYKELPALKTIGYQEFFDYFEGKISLSEAVNKFKQHSRNYAKRQMTWFRKDKNIIWFEANYADEAEKFIIRYLEEQKEKDF